MAVCYFNNKYEQNYDCQYEIKEDGIEIIINYDISEEIPAINGIKSFGSDTQFEERDILIIDYQARINYLLKDAYYSGHSEVLGTPDGGYKTKFFSHVYMYDSNYEKLSELSKDNKIKKVRVYSDTINQFIGYPSLYREKNENDYIIKLKRISPKEVVEINRNNIKSLIISDYWTNENKYNNNELIIKLNGYVEIEFKEYISYDNVYDYVKELMIYFQLLKPYKFYINKMSVEIEGYYYGLWIQTNEINYKDSYIESSVNDSINGFLLNCYTAIPYRNSKNEIRNIPYIILKTSRNLEDNFLMLYRFIECYYKKQDIKNVKTNFIKYSIENNYKNINEIKDRNIENLTFEIISLRNHYVHEGYYIKDKRLYIAFPRIGKKVNQKNYTAENVDSEWIYERTKILYEIVIDIIFRNMLNYDNYRYNKHF